MRSRTSTRSSASMTTPSIFVPPRSMPILSAAEAWMSSTRTRYQGSEQPRPVEHGTGVGLASGCDLTVPDDRAERKTRVTIEQRRRDDVEGGGLRIGVWDTVSAFELDADRKIVAGDSPTPL